MKNTKKITKLTKKDIETIILKQFLELSNIVFDLRKLNTKSENREPIDLEYDNQGYQITTGDGEYFGRIMSVTEKYDISNVQGRIVSRLLNFNSIVESFLNRILEKKKNRSDVRVILLISILTVDPFRDDEREEEYKKFATKNQSLLKCWEEVYCIFQDKQLIKLF